MTDMTNPKTRPVTKEPQEVLDWARDRVGRAMLALETLDNFHFEDGEDLLIRKSEINSSPVERLQEMTSTAVSQANRIVQGRVGSIVPVGMPANAVKEKVHQVYCICSMGEETYPSSLSRLYRMVGEGKKSPVYSAPFRHEEYDYSVCQHVHNQLKEAFPGMAKEWAKMRKAAVDAKNMGREVEIEKKWFRRDFGLYYFISDVGAEQKGEVLKRVHSGKFNKHGYAWVKAGEGANRKKATVQQRKLAARYHPYRAKANEQRVPFLFENAKHMAHVLEQGLPEGGSLGSLRLKWIDANEKGYTPENFEWVKKASSAVRKNTVLVADGMANFAGYVMELPLFQLVNMRLMEILLEGEAETSVEGAIEQVIAEFDLLK